MQLGASLSQMGLDSCDAESFEILDEAFRVAVLGGFPIDGVAGTAIDGEIFQDPYLEPIEPDSEVFVLPKIGGG